MTSTTNDGILSTMKCTFCGSKSKIVIMLNETISISICDKCTSKITLAENNNEAELIQLQSTLFDFLSETLPLNSSRLLH